MTKEAHVSEYKKKVVKKFEDLIKEYPIVGALNLQDMPAPQLQQMREKLRKDVVILMSKRRLLKIAIENSKDVKKGIEKLEEHLKGMPALLFTKENPFKLFKTIKKNKTKAPAKPGQIAPMDIVVKAGPTPFTPGPIISELGKFGLKAGVEGAKVAIKEDAVVCKEGEEINAELAGLLLKLGIEPMEIGLDLVAVYEDGIIYGKDVLDIDDEEFMNNLQNAARWSINLAVEAGYLTKEVVNLMIPKAYNDALALAREQDILTSESVGEVLAKAESQMKSLKETANISDGAKPEAEEKPKEKAPTKVEEKKEEVKEDRKAEEKKESKEEKKEAETPKEETKKEEAKVEEKKEEPKVEEKHEIEEAQKDEVKEEPKEEPESVREEVKEEPKQEEKSSPSPDVQAEQQKAEELFEELKKKGTLRDVNQKHEIKVPEEKTPEQIIAEGVKKQKEKTR